MFWDACSDADIESNIDHRNAFAMAAQEVINKCGTVDPGLSHGWLYCTASRDVMIDVAERSSVGWGCAWFNAGMARVDVKSRAQLIAWDRLEPVYENKWAFWSVRKFVETCAELNLRIRFATEENQLI